MITAGTADPVQPHVLEREYTDSFGDIVVSSSSRYTRESVQNVLHSYSYNARPLIEAWEMPGDRISSTSRIEMVTAASAFALMDFKNVRLEARKPPEPDLFASTEDAGLVAVEVTQNVDPDEKQFQRAMAEFVAMLNSRLLTIKEQPFSGELHLGFNRVPARPDHERLMTEMISQIMANRHIPGVQHFSGELAEIFAQYIVSKSGEGARFIGGGVWDVRGHPDLYRSTMDCIERKRDKTVYNTDGRPLWLAVGMEPRGLFMPDIMGEVYGASLTLGKFARIAFVQFPDLVMFVRRGGDHIK